MLRMTFKYIALLCFHLFLTTYVSAQYTSTDSLLNILPTLLDNEEKVDVLNQLSYSSYRCDVSKNLDYGHQALSLAEKI